VIHYSFKDAGVKNFHKGAKKEKITKAGKEGIIVREPFVKSYAYLSNNNGFVRQHG
jgi:hypothetical protein